jgi:hypothetical protein
MDELSLMGTGAIDAIDNLSTGGSDRFQCIGSGNPKDPLDPLGKLAEPDCGWDLLQQEKKTMTWRTRGGGRAVQLYGPDTPNVDGSFPGLINPATIQQRIDFYGDADDFRIAMMLYGIMPKLTVGRRILTMDFCIEKRAFDQITWDGTKRKRVAFLDPGKVLDGDRKILTFAEFGMSNDGRQILALENQINIPVKNIASSVDRQMVDYVRTECLRRGIRPDQFGFDSTGNATLMAEFARLWSPDVVALDFGGSAPDRPVRNGAKEVESKAYRNRVTGLWYAVREVIGQSQLRKLSRECAEEGCQREYEIKTKVGDTVQIQVETKDDMKKRTKRSPDLMDSLAGCVEIARRHGFEIGYTPTQPEKREDPLRDMGSKYRDLLKSKALVRC